MAPIVLALAAEYSLYVAIPEESSIISFTMISKVCILLNLANWTLDLTSIWLSTSLTALTFLTASSAK